MQGVQVPLLVGELRSHMPYGQEEEKRNAGWQHDVGAGL